MRHALFSILFATAAVACGGSKPAPAKPVVVVEKPVEKPAEKPAEPPAPPSPKHATATMAPTKKFKASGTITFKEVEGGVEVTANLEGLKPGEHGFHIHEKGDCSAPDAKSAGGHFNPGGHKHGGPDADEHHAGDLGNLKAGKDGKATKTFTMQGITLGDDPTSIAGKGFIVHEKADDLKTQPTGNAGDRAACGVITLDP